MRLILDAHIVIWSVTNDPRLAAQILELIAGQVDPIAFSVAQLWEVEIKAAARLMPGVPDFAGAVVALNLELLPILPDDAVRAAHLPRHHGDPFDRMLIAQALARDLMIVTHDRAFEPYVVPILWA
jgi:PIN domain nuclease of toxin-antitoxin system